MSIHNKINRQTNETWVSCGNDFPRLLPKVLAYSSTTKGS